MFRFLWLSVALLLIAALYTSCVSTPERSRGSLSGAMDTARDDNGADRSVPDYNRNPPPNSIPDPNERLPERPSADSPGGNDKGSSGSVSALSGEPLRLWLGLRGANATASDHEIQTLGDCDIFIRGEVTPKVDITFYAGMKVANPVSDSDLDASAKDGLLFFKAGMEGQYMPFPDWKILSPYVFAGVGGYTMFWSFQNSLTAGGEIITGDSIGGMLLTVGAGIYPVNLDRFRIGVNVIPETYLFGPVTQEGFDNDYFTIFNTLKLSVEMSFRL